MSTQRKFSFSQVLASRNMLRSLAVAAVMSLTVAMGIVSAHAVVIQETFDPLTGQGEFTVINNSPGGIFAFAVRNDALEDASTDSSVALDVWIGLLVTKEQWDANNLNVGTMDPMETVFNGLPDGDIAEPAFGSFDSLFGAGSLDSLVALYLVTDTDPGPTSAIVEINSGETQGGFLFEAGVPASPFVAFSQTGDPETPQTFTTGVTSDPSVVPLPAALPLFGTGLGLLGFIGWRRRRQAAAAL